MLYEIFFGSGLSMMGFRQLLKTGVCSEETNLMLGEMKAVEVGELKGSGNFVVINNATGEKVVVRYLKIAVAEVINKYSCGF